MVKTKIKTINSDDIFGQYASDWALQSTSSAKHFKDMTGTLDVRGDGNTAFHHGALLFDHIDKTPDEATGTVPSEDDQEAQYQEAQLHIGKLPVVQATRPDAAELWLRQHDPECNNNSKERH